MSWINSVLMSLLIISAAVGIYDLLWNCKKQLDDDDQAKNEEGEEC